MTLTRLAENSLDCLLSPRSVAIVGASSDQRRFGGRPIQYLLEAGFPGPIYPINPSRAEIQGLMAYPSIEAMPRPVDCALLAVGADDTLTTLKACAARGVRSAVLFGAGFAEVGDEGAQLQERALELARGAGMRLLGPNCMGLMSPRARFYGTFASALEDYVPPPGDIGLVSQSGGYGGYVMRHAFKRGLGFASWVTTGNESDVEAGEVMRWMADREDVKVIVAYLEGIRRGDLLIEALDLARRNGKPVVAMKVGRSAQGRVAAISHTASLAGEDSAYDAVFHKYGVHRARTSEELIDIAYAVSRNRGHAVGRNVGVISISGGVGVQIADYLDDEGLTLADTPEATKAELRALVPACSPSNPIDMTGLMTTNHDLMEMSLDAAFRSGAFDAVIVFVGISGLAPSMAAPLREALSKARAKHPDRLLIVSVSTSDEEIRAYEAAGCLVFEDPSRATKALGALAKFAEADRSTWPVDDLADEPKVSATALDEPAAKQLLAAIGVPLPREVLAATAEDAAVAAEAIGGPVALKVVSPDIAHKTEVGGVALGLVGAAAVSDAFVEMDSRVRARCPHAQISGYLVSEMVGGGVEMIVGVNRDATFGPIVTVGLGGVLVELMRDTVTAPAPVNPVQARQMVASIRSAPLLTGWRGSPPLAVDALANVVSAVSRLAAANPTTIAGIEINPLRVREHDVVALDLLITAMP